MPIACPNCGTIMDLKEFIFDKAIIVKFLPFVSRAPPKKELAEFAPDKDGVRYIRSDDGIADTDFNQLRSETDGDFDQSTNW